MELMVRSHRGGGGRVCVVYAAYNLIPKGVDLHGDRKIKPKFHNHYIYGFIKSYIT